MTKNRIFSFFFLFDHACHLFKCLLNRSKEIGFSDWFNWLENTDTLCWYYAQIKMTLWPYFTFITPSEGVERVEELIAEVFPPCNNLRWLAQEHDEAIRSCKSRQLISGGIVNLFLSSWRGLIGPTFNINITSRKNCVTVKRAPRDKTICWTPSVIIHVGDTRMPVRDIDFARTTGGE